MEKIRAHLQPGHLSDRGLQDADAQNILQQVLLSIKRSLEERRHDPTKARFRTWLAVVVRHATINAISRRRPDQGTGGSNVQQQLNTIQSEASDNSLFDREVEREIFRKAASIIKHNFDRDTWRAFWATAIEATAQELGKQTGNIYTSSQSRVAPLAFRSYAAHRRMERIVSLA